jgi:PAS domain S-box-containing protein
MTKASFDLRLLAARQRIQALNQRAAVAPQPSQPLLDEILEEFSITLEELSVAHEELQRRNQELATSSWVVAVERQRYQELFDCAPNGCVLTDPKGIIHEANQAAAALFKVRQDFLVGKPLALYLQESDRQDFRQQLIRLQKGEQVQGWEVSVRPRDGLPVPVALSATSVRDVMGKGVALRWVLFDLSERKQAEAVLQEKAAFVSLLESIASAANEAATIEDAFQFTLEQVCAHTGWCIGHAYVLADQTPDTLNLVATLYPEDITPFAAFRSVTQKTLYTRGVGLPGQVLADGKPVWVTDVTTDPQFVRTRQAVDAGLKAMFAFPVLVGKIVVGVCEFFATETVEPNEALLEVMGKLGMLLGRVVERKRAEERLRESERLAAIGTTTAKLAHEIGNPLNGMYTTVQLLERYLAQQKAPVDENLHSTVHDLVTEINRLRTLLEELRAFSRRPQLKLEPTSLAAVAADVLAIAAPGYAAQGIHLEQSFPPELPLVMADREKLKQVLLNLCKNAAEAMPEGGTLTVQGFHAGGQVRLEIKDTGAGIPEHVNIFDPFVTTKPEGTGLGLAIARQIVMAHKGSLTYTRTPRQGTTFTLALPSRQETEEPAAKVAD